MQLKQILQGIADAGFTPRGGFHPRPEDGAPEVDTGRPARTLLLVGNAGPAMWDRFARECDPKSDLLDDWSRKTLDALAGNFNAKALFPFTKPHFPFQRWAQRAEACHASPLGIFIHPDYGLWHAYRGALVFAETLDLPPRDARPSPCESCTDTPCLSTCPVEAFTGETYDVPACATHIATPAGRDCMSRGCRARRACPIGRSYVYSPEQAEFHMTAFLRARRADNTI